MPTRNTLEREEQRHEAKLAKLRADIDEGDSSGIAEGDSFCAREGEAKDFQKAALIRSDRSLWSRLG
jgi:hypothetical protein